MNKPFFVVVGLNGANVGGFETRAYAYQYASQLNKETDLEKQDREDREFCAKYGVPFQPRRYFVTEETAHV